MNLRYRTVVGWSSQDACFEAAVPTLGVMGRGKTAAAAMKAAHRNATSRIKEAEGRHDQMPDPDVMDRFSGNIRLRLPRRLHQSLAELAEEEGMSLNMIIVAILGEALGQRPQRRRKLLSDAVEAAGLSDKLGEAVSRWDGHELRCYTLPIVGASSDLAVAKEEWRRKAREQPWGVDIGAIKWMLSNPEGKRLDAELRNVGLYYLNKPGRGRRRQPR